MGTNSLGRVYGKYTHSVGDGYGYSKLSINFPEIMALAALVIHVPGVLGAIETNAFALHLKNISLEMGTNSLGRVYGKYTHSVGDGYGYSKLSINFPEIMALAALVIHVPGVLGAIETIGAVISIFD